MALVNASSMGTRLGIVAVAMSTALVVVALAVAPFLSPAWVAFEQGRTGAAELTGFSESPLRTATDAILTDLVLGPPDFDVTVDRFQVLTEAERSHMRDVRDTFAGFFTVAAAALVVLLTAFWLAGRNGSRWTRRGAWRGVRLGALGLTIGTIAAGVIALVAFDVAFEVFHRLFFASGTYRFDPATSRLVQLFPDAFWSETSIAVGGVILALAAGTAWFAGRRATASAGAAVASAGGAPERLDSPGQPAGERGPAR